MVIVAGAGRIANSRCDAGIFTAAVARVDIVEIPVRSPDGSSAAASGANPVPFASGTSAEMPAELVCACVGESGGRERERECVLRCSANNN